MAVFKNDITLDGSQAKQELSKITDDAKRTNDAMKDSTTGIKNAAKELNNAGASASNYKRKLAQLTRTITDMTVNYRNLTDAEKASASGREMANKIQELTQKAGEWKDTVGDVRNAIKAQASDTHLWDAAAQGLDIAKSGIESFISLTGMADKNSKAFQQTMQKLAAVETGFNTVIKITNALQKDSALMQGIMTIKTKLLVKETQNLTLAQKACNLVAKANPYLLIATAIAALIPIILGLSGAFKKNADDVEESKKRVESFRKSMDDLKTSTASAVGDTVGKFQVLAKKWSELKTIAEKKQFIKDNATEFNNLGLQIGSVSDAEDIFVKNTGSVIAALESRAKAQAGYEALLDSYKKYYEDLNDLENVKGGGYYTRYDPNSKNEGNRKVSIEEARAAGVEIKSRQTNKPMVMNGMAGGVSSSEYYFEQTKENIDKINAYRNKKAYETQQKGLKNAKEDLGKRNKIITKQIDEANKALANSPFVRGGNDKGKNSTTSTKTKKTLKEQISDFDKASKEFEDRVTKLDKAYAGGKIQAKYYYEEIAKSAKSYTDKIADIDPNLISTEKYNDAMAKLNAVTEELEKLNNPEGVKLDLSQIKTKPIELELAPIDTSKALSSVELMIQQFKEKTKDMDFASVANEASNKIGEIMDAYDWGAIGADAAQEMIDAINLMLEQIGLKPLKVKIEPEGMKKMDKALTGISDTVGNLGNAFSSLGSAFEDDGLNIAGTIAQSIATLIMGAMQATKDAANFGPWAWIAFGSMAMAQVAAMVSQIHGLSGYAEGGIVNSGSVIGDRNLIRVNGNEMVLTTAQQTKLFSILNGNNNYLSSISDGSSVEFVIKGENLVGVQRNFTKRKGLIGR